MYDICTIGHITLDKIVTPQSVTYMPGGTAFYFCKALQHFNINHMLVTALAEKENYIIQKLEEDGIKAIAIPSPETLFFENIYNENQDNRIQNVLATAIPFEQHFLENVHASIFHLGPLLNNDFSSSFIQQLSTKGMLSLDVQGLLRILDNQKVVYKDWEYKKEALPYISILKANDYEMEILTGMKNERDGAKYLADLGCREVIITMGSRGSLIYTGNIFYDIPAFIPKAVIDATGCGDTYMAGYLYKKINGAGIEESGKFAAAMASIKIAAHGPFSGNKLTVENFLNEHMHDTYSVSN